MTALLQVAVAYLGVALLVGSAALLAVQALEALDGEYTPRWVIVLVGLCWPVAAALAVADMAKRWRWGRP